jgi:septal ring factor EnvC (AmiA/AmiB activator)
MEWSGRVIVAAGTLGAIWLCWGVVALAQEDAATEPKPLGTVLGVRSEGNDEAAEVQERIDEISDETDELLSQYRTVLKQIDSIDLYNRQMRELIAAQEAEVASLQDQLSRVQEVGRSVTPLMLRMVDAIEKFVQLDVPFLIEERTERIAALRQMMGRADVTTAEKFRQSRTSTAARSRRTAPR